MAFTRSGVRSPSPPSRGWAGLGGLGQPYTGDWVGVRFWRHAGIAQLVEHNLAKVGVAGSSPVSRSPRPARSSKHTDAGWSSLVARRAHNPEVVGSNPTPATSIMRNAKFEMRNVHFALSNSTFRISVRAVSSVG